MVKKILNKIGRDIRFRDKIEHIETLPSREGTYQKVENLPSYIQNYLENNGINLYQHQAQAFELLRKKENVLITTPTASGKTLAFNLPIMEELGDDKSTALYIYPAKALANDQWEVLKDLEKELGLDLKPFIYDGDTPKSDRPYIKRHSRLVLTNPYELHLILYWHHQWARFYRNLKFVVIDEAHQYRGVFGSNVAFLIRRLRRICKYYGSDPQFILSSATLANHQEFSQKLVGKPFQVVTQDTSPRGEKHFILYNPYKKKSDLSVHQETQNLFLYFILHELQTLCFTVSRKMAELIAMWSKKEIDLRKPKLTEKITAYRAGYLASERRLIEEKLRNQELIGVTTTNALELGINIGSLDAVIISGYPGTMISTWQQAGRSGRRKNDSLVVLLAFQNALDQYFMKNPHFFFDKPHENAIIDLHNPHIIQGHLLCAIHELPLTKKELEEYFYGDPLLLEEAERDGLIRNNLHKWMYIAGDNPAFKHGLDEISSDIFRVMHSGRLLERMERSQAYREAHEGAVLINQGETYTVESFDNKKRIINVARRSVDYHTQVLKEVDIKVLEKIENRQIGGLKVHFGVLEVREDFHKYKLLNYRKVLGTYPLDLPPLKFETRGMWFTLPSHLKEVLEEKFTGDDIFAGGLHGTEHALIALFPLHVMCDRMDIGGLSTPYHPDTQAPTIFIYDAHKGGIGLAEKAIQVFEELIKSTRDLITTCNCKEGCPSCIYSPKCGNENRPLHKEATSYILKKMMQEAESGQLKEVIGEYQKPVKDTPHAATAGSESYIEFDSVDKLKSRSLELMESGKLDEALSLITNALDMQPESWELLKIKGQLLDLNGDSVQGVEYLSKALQLKPSNLQLSYLLSIALYHSEEYLEAKLNLLDIIKKDPQFYNAWYLLGVILQSQGDIPGAIQYFSRVLTLNPDHEQAADSLRKLL